MEQYILLCLDCHEIYPGRENHSCIRKINTYFTARVERANGQVTRLHGSTISKSSTYEDGTDSQSAVSTTSQKNPSDRMRKTVKPTCQTFIEQDTALRFFAGGDFRDGLFEFESKQPKQNLNAWPTLQDNGYYNCTPQEVCTSHFHSVSDDLLTDDNVSLVSPENMGASACPSNGWDLIDRYELLDAEAHKRPEDGCFECPVCGKLSNRKTRFFAHYRTHTGEKPYACDMCEKKFNTQEYLTTHRRAHTGEKPYSCDMCEKKFSQKHGLVAHRRTHTGEKPYSCDMCEKKFNQKHGLDIHRRTHTGERPYPCDKCDHKCIDKSHLERHRKTHMGREKHKCTICGKCFASASSLNNHYKNYHSEK